MLEFLKVAIGLLRLLMILIIFDISIEEVAKIWNEYNFGASHFPAKGPCDNYMNLDEIKIIKEDDVKFPIEIFCGTREKLFCYLSSKEKNDSTT
jgi:hypothetical protein